MIFFPCSYLEVEVKLTDEREQHIIERHPDLLPQYTQYIAETLLAPEQIRRSRRVNNILLFSRWFDKVQNGKYVVVVLVTNNEPTTQPWITAAYFTKKLNEGDLIWQKT